MSEYKFLSTEEFIERIRAVAKELGWAIGVHGSLKRDIDLIGVPWIEKACSVTVLYLALREEFDGGSWEQKPRGRVAFILLQKGANVKENYKDWEPMQVDLSLVDGR